MWTARLPRRRRLVTAVVTALAAVTAVSACSAPTASAPSGAGSGPGPSAAADEYRPGMRATVRLPARRGATDVVVLVPGGGWQTADPAGLVPLAERLTADGAVTSTITYGTASTGAWFPRPADDVACAIRWSVAEAAAAGRPASRVVVVGHSAGGHLAALVALSGSRFGSSCASPPVRIDGLVGLAGVYDVTAASDIALTLFGVRQADDPQRWRDGDPTWWAGQREDGDAGPTVLLLHGDADTLVPVSQTQGLAALLEARGLDTTVEVVPGQDHRGIYAVDVAGPRIARWLRSRAVQQAG